MELKVFNTLGKEVGEITVSDSIFGAEYNEALIHQVVVAQLANKRQGTKSALTRTEVRGGGIKPWRQKRHRQSKTRQHPLAPMETRWYRVCSEAERFLQEDQ